MGNGGDKETAPREAARDPKKRAPDPPAPSPVPDFLMLQDTFGNAGAQRMLSDFSASKADEPTPAPLAPATMQVLHEDETTQATVAEEVPVEVPEHPLDDQPFLRASLPDEVWEGLEKAAIRREYLRREQTPPLDQGMVVFVSSTDELFAPIEIAESMAVLDLLDRFSGDSEPTARDMRLAGTWAATEAERAFRESVRGLPLTVALDDPDGLAVGASRLRVWYSNQDVSTDDGLVTLAAFAECAPRTLEAFTLESAANADEIFQARQIEINGGSELTAASNAADFGEQMPSLTQWADLDAHATSCSGILQATRAPLRPRNGELAPRLQAIAKRASTAIDRLNAVSQTVRDFNRSKVDRNIWDIIVNQPDEDWEQGNYVSSIGGGLLSTAADFLSLGDTTYQVKARNALFKGQISYADYQALGDYEYASAAAHLALDLLGAELAGPGGTAFFGIGSAWTPEIAAATRLIFGAFGTAVANDAYQLAVAHATGSPAVRDYALSQIQGPVDALSSAAPFAAVGIATARYSGSATRFKVADEALVPVEETEARPQRTGFVQRTLQKGLASFTLGTAKIPALSGTPAAGSDIRMRAPRGLLTTQEPFLRIAPEDLPHLPDAPRAPAPAQTPQAPVVETTAPEPSAPVAPPARPPLVFPEDMQLGLAGSQDPALTALGGSSRWPASNRVVWREKETQRLWQQRGRVAPFAGAQTAQTAFPLPGTERFEGGRNQRGIRVDFALPDLSFVEDSKARDWSNHANVVDAAASIEKMIRVLELNLPPDLAAQAEISISSTRAIPKEAQREIRKRIAMWMRDQGFSARKIYSYLDRLIFNVSPLK